MALGDERVVAYVLGGPWVLDEGGVGGLLNETGPERT